MLKQIKIDRTFIILGILIVILIGFIIGFRQDIFNLISGEKPVAKPIVTPDVPTLSDPASGKVAAELLSKAQENMQNSDNSSKMGTNIGSYSDPNTNQNSNLSSATDSASGQSVGAKPGGDSSPSATKSGDQAINFHSLRNPFQNLFKPAVPKQNQSVYQEGNPQYPGMAYNPQSSNNSSYNTTYQDLSGLRNPQASANLNRPNSTQPSNSNSSSSSGQNSNQNSTVANSGQSKTPPQSNHGETGSAAKPEIVYPPYTLNGIVAQGDIKKALLVTKNQSQIVTKGDILQTWVVSDIDKDRVLLTNKEGQRFILTLEGVTLDEGKNESKK